MYANITPICKDNRGLNRISFKSQVGGRSVEPTLYTVYVLDGPSGHTWFGVNFDCVTIVTKAKSVERTLYTLYALDTRDLVLDVIDAWASFWTAPYVQGSCGSSSNGMSSISNSTNNCSNSSGWEVVCRSSRYVRKMRTPWRRGLHLCLSSSEAGCRC